MGSVTTSVDRAGCGWLQYDYDAALIPQDRPPALTMWRYRGLLPVPDGPVRYPCAVLEAVRQSGGGMAAVTERALQTAVEMLACRAGVGAEPAGAAALAGLVCAIDRGMVDRSETVVLLVTGREVQAVGAPADLTRTAVVERLDEVERALADDCTG